MIHFKTRSFVVLLTLFISIIGNTINAQDTSVVQTLTFDSTSRSGYFAFPDDPNKKYEKIIMQYRMRCKDAQVSDANDRNKGCGEWDYSCNTYIVDSNHIDSILNFSDNYRITNFTGTTYDYTPSPTFDYYLTLQQNVVVNSTVNETLSLVGNGNLTIDNTIAAQEYTGKSQYLFTASELISAGVVQGDLDGIIINCLNTPTSSTDFLRVKIKPTTKTSLDASTPDLTGFTEVYSHNTSLVQGNNRLQFYTPFNWDGTSNIIIEYSFKNDTGTNSISLSGENTNNNYGIYTSGDRTFTFNTSNYIEADSYKGISGASQRTVEAWIKSTVANKEIVSWGVNSAGQKFVLRLNDNGTLRAEVNGGYVYGVTPLDDGEWHHVACTFAGSDVTDIKLFVDGTQESLGGSLTETINTNTTNGINLRISRGVNTRYFEGQIDDVRIWSTELSSTTLQDWMHKSMDNSHPNIANLEAHYLLNNSTGTTVQDVSGNNRNATVQLGYEWTKYSGEELFKNFENTTNRPNTTFLQGTYNLSINTDSVFDSIPHPANLVEEIQVISNAGTINSDELGILSSNYYYGAGNQNYYDESGNLMNSIPINTTSSITIQANSLNYYARSASNFEIMSFVTPYGIGIDFGTEGKMWEFDMTDFTPILKGNKWMYMSRGGQFQEEMDIRFLFIEGTPERDVIDIQQLWKVDSRNYTDIMSDRYFAPIDVKANANASTFKLRSAITGHGQEGEFIPRTHTVNLNGGSDEFIWNVWTECGANPIYPQGGTWIYDRAGWCPGQATDLEENDVTSYMTPGSTTNIDYSVTTATGDSRYIVNHQLVSYGNPNFTNNAAVVDVISPSLKAKYERDNAICASPRIIIRNSGSDPLYSVKIKYWTTDENYSEEHQWIGVLNFGEETEVTLPSTDQLWYGVTETGNIFHVELFEPNSQVDEYTNNDVYSSEFDIPEFLPEEIYLHFRTNNAASESSYELLDGAGNVLFSRNNMTNSTQYRDTFNLEVGECYKFKFYDTDDDGIDFWANSDGSGQLRIYDVNGSTPIAIKTFDGDYGDGFEYNFTIGKPLLVTERNQNIEFKVYPNPANDEVSIETEGFEKQITIEIFDALGKLVYQNSNQAIEDIFYSTIDLSSLPSGMYSVRVNDDNHYQSKMFIKK